MSANAAFCPSCGSKRVIGGPSDGGDSSAPEAGRIVLVNSGGEIVTPGEQLTKSAAEIVVLEADGSPALTIYPDPILAGRDPSAAEGDLVRPVSDRRVPLTFAAVAGVFGMVVLVVLVALRSGSDGFDVDASVAVGESGLTDSADSFSGVQKVADAREAGALAAHARDEVSTQLSRLDRIDSRELRQATRELLTAQEAVLTDWAGLAELRVGEIEQWPETSDQIRTDMRALRAAQSALFDRGATEIMVDVESSMAALRHVDDVFTEDVSLLTAWHTDLARATEEKDRQQALAFLYGAKFRDLTARYGNLRESLDGFTDRVDAGVVLVYEGYQELGEATASREDVRNLMAALRPPDGLSAAHSTMLSVLDDAIGACQSAAEGLNLYINGPFYSYVGETPGWETFLQASDRITTSFDGARETWENAYAGEVARIDQIQLPPRPAI